MSVMCVWVREGGKGSVWVTGRGERSICVGDAERGRGVCVWVTRRGEGRGEECVCG